MSARRGFTLIEVTVCTAIAMAMAGVCVGAFVQVRKTILRSEALLAMHDRAQVIYHALYRDFQATMPDCAMAIMTAPGGVDLVMMRGKEDSFDFDPGADNHHTDLVWDEWRWKGGTLSTGCSSPTRRFTVSRSLAFGAVDYHGTTCLNLPLPRRWLDPSTPMATLDDNVYFPDAWGVSRADPSQDLGDRADLERNLAPVAEGVSDLCLQCVFHDGTTRTFDGSGATPGAVIQGVWLDGRLAPRLSDPPDWSHSPVPKRPALMRVRFTLADPRIALRQTYSFSFSLPALTPSS